MEIIWMGGTDYPRNALYFGFGTKDGLDNKGCYQAIITDNPESFKTENTKLNNSRIFISPCCLSKKAMQNAKNYSGLGEFEAFPDLQQIVNRLEELDTHT